MARISKPPEERRQELVRAAQELFMERGYEGTMVGDIVRRVGVAQGLFYYYFRSKQEIFLAVIDRLTQEKVDELALSLRDGSIPLPARVQQVLHTVTAFLREMDGMYPKDRGAVAGEVSAISSSHVSSVIEPLMTDVLREGAAEGLVSAPYPELLSRFIISGLIGVQNSRRPPRADDMMALIVYALSRLLGLSAGAEDGREEDAGGRA